jgi:hypothetical protein
VRCGTALFFLKAQGFPELLLPGAPLFGLLLPLVASEKEFPCELDVERSEFPETFPLAPVPPELLFSTRLQPIKSAAPAIPMTSFFIFLSVLLFGLLTKPHPRHLAPPWGNFLNPRVEFPQCGK